MNNHERAAHLYIKAEKQGMDAPSEGMIADAIHDAEQDRETEIIYWITKYDPDLAAKFERDNQLKSLEDSI